MLETIKETVNKRSIVVIIVLSSVLVLLFIGVAIASVKASHTHDEEQEISEYKVKEAALKSEYEKTNAEIAYQVSNITTYEHKLAYLETQIKMLEEDIQKVSEELSYIVHADERNLIISAVGLAVGLGFNILTGVSDIKKHRAIADLGKQELALLGDLIKMIKPVNDLADPYIANLVRKGGRLVVSKKLIYQASVDGFDYTTLHNGLCGAVKQYDLLVTITATTGHRFGVIVTASWPCEDKDLVNNKTVTFSLDKTAVAHAKNDTIVVTDDPEYLLNIGSGEILVFENKTGKVDAGKAFDLPENFNPPFYVPESNFDVEEILVERFSFRSV